MEVGFKLQQQVKIRGGLNRFLKVKPEAKTGAGLSLSSNLRQLYSCCNFDNFNIFLASKNEAITFPPSFSLLKFERQ